MFRLAFWLCLLFSFPVNVVNAQTVVITGMETYENVKFYVGEKDGKPEIVVKPLLQWSSQATGSIVKWDGTHSYILTCSHAHAGDMKLSVADYKKLEEKYPADVYARDAQHDLMMLRVEKDFKKRIKIARRGAEAGEKLFFLGYYTELKSDQNHINKVVKPGRLITAIGPKLLLTSQPVPGNSGGPVFSVDEGNEGLLGVVTAVGLDDGIGHATGFDPVINFLRKYLPK